MTKYSKSRFGAFFLLVGIVFIIVGIGLFLGIDILGGSESDTSPELGWINALLLFILGIPSAGIGFKLLQSGLQQGGWGTPQTSGSSLSQYQEQGIIDPEIQIDQENLLEIAKKTYMAPLFIPEQNSNYYHSTFDPFDLYFARDAETLKMGQITLVHSQWFFVKLLSANPSSTDLTSIAQAKERVIDALKSVFDSQHKDDSAWKGRSSNYSLHFYYLVHGDLSQSELALLGDFHKIKHKDRSYLINYYLNLRTGELISSKVTGLTGRPVKNFAKSTGLSLIDTIIQQIRSLDKITTRYEEAPPTVLTEEPTEAKSTTRLKYEAIFKKKTE
ncbi:MAG: hypothetical protein ACFFB2_19270 [Promethearchaeota archaeon]